MNRWQGLRQIELKLRSQKRLLQSLRLAAENRLCLGIAAWLGLFAWAGSAESQESDLAQALASYPNRIVCEAYENDNWDLFVLSADGSQREPLTATPKQHEMYPQVSPDGTKICFLCDVQRGDGTVRSVQMMNMDGTGRITISERARQPCWSPDGKSIAFVKQEFDRFDIKDFVSKGLMIYDVETGQTRAAGNDKIHHVYTLNWAANGKWIVSTVHGGMGFGHAIVAYEIDGDRVIDLGISGCRPNLTPDGQRITWSSDDHTVNIGDLRWTDEGVEVVNNTVLHHEEKLHTYHPDWSADGKYVIFSLGPGGRVRANGPGTHTEVAEMIGVRGEWELVVKQAADPTGPMQKLTHSPGSTTKEADWIPTAAR